MDEILPTLEKILEQRKSATADNSYVASLYNQGTDKILDKISEESAEVIKAAKEGDLLSSDISVMEPTLKAEINI